MVGQAGTHPHQSHADLEHVEGIPSLGGRMGLDSIAVSLFGNMTVELGEIHIITKEYQNSIRTKYPNNHSDTETGTLSRIEWLWIEQNSNK